MTGHVAAIFRHPVKGFTPESLTYIDVAPETGIAFDRLWAVENGPSGFDPAEWTFMPKQKFTVLMSIPRVAAARTHYEDDTGLLHAHADGLPPFSGKLTDEAGREGFAAWLTALLPEDDRRGALKVVTAPGEHRFTDHPKGQLSVVNLASVRELSQRMGVELDPLRFRANLYVEGWPAWAENDWTNQAMMLGFAQASVFKPIVRCAATHVNPTTAERDQDVVKALFDNYGHMNCGIYVHITASGRITVGDAATAPDAKPVESPEWA